MTDRFSRYQRMICDRPHPKVLRITLTNGKMNTADAVMQEELLTIWRDIDADRDVHAVIITGAGSVFSAGGDLNWQKMWSETTAREHAVSRMLAIL